MISSFVKESILAAILALCFTGPIRSQAIVNLKAGVESWMLQDEHMLSGVSQHPGQFLGFDVFVEHNRALFVPGFHYHRISVENESEKLSFDLSKPHHLHYFTIPVTVGYRWFDRSLINFSTMIGGEVTFFYDLDPNNVGLDDDMLYGVSTGLTGVAQIELASVITFDVKYHYALQPIIKIRDESKLRGWTFAAGIKF